MIIMSKQKKEVYRLDDSDFLIDRYTYEEYLEMVENSEDDLVEIK